MVIWESLTKSWEKKREREREERKLKAEKKKEKERYTHLNSEFWRIALRHKKAFLSERWKEIEDNNRMGKIRYLFEKITETRGTFNAKIDTIKNRYGMDLPEAEDIKKKWQEYTELYQKRF